MDFPLQLYNITLSFCLILLNQRSRDWINHSVTGHRRCLVGAIFPAKSNVGDVFA